MSYKISILKIKQHLKENREKQVLLVAYFFEGSFLVNASLLQDH